MSIYGIGTAGYPMTGYEPRKTPRSAAANNYTNQMSSVTQTTQMSSGTFELHISMIQMERRSALHAVRIIP